jgi:HPt (histidine-containing phosphotransfer) domain-containing protein
MAKWVGLTLPPLTLTTKEYDLLELFLRDSLHVFSSDEIIDDTWVTTKPECLERLKTLTATVDRLRLGNGTDAEQQQAHQQAHKLVGTLGMFSLMSGMEIARQIERLFEHLPSTGLTPTEAEILPTLLAELIAEIEHGEPRQITTVSNLDLPLLLLIDLVPSCAQSLQVMADDRGFRTLVLPTIEAAKNYLTTILCTGIIFALTPPSPSSSSAFLPVEKLALP